MGRSTDPCGDGNSTHLHIAYSLCRLHSTLRVVLVARAMSNDTSWYSGFWLLVSRCKNGLQELNSLAQDRRRWKLTTRQAMDTWIRRRRRRRRRRSIEVCGSNTQNFIHRATAVQLKESKYTRNITNYRKRKKSHINIIIWFPFLPCPCLTEQADHNTPFATWTGVIIHDSHRSSMRYPSRAVSSKFFLMLSRATSAMINRRIIAAPCAWLAPRVTQRVVSKWMT